jgi:tRNA-Thr(GGU) m(6)t(6)A37 methyltransferase TsaA
MAKIKIYKEWQPEQALEGLAGFSHLWVIFEFHQNKTSGYHAKVHPPRLGGKQMGVFATRSPHRPNNIGLSLVKIEKITKDEVWVSGIDLVDGTPVFDIKPYLPEVESIPTAKSGWTGDVAAAEKEVVWPEELLAHLGEWEQKIQIPGLRALVEETLRLDPRPVVYRGFEGQESPYRQVHAVRLYDGDIHFEFETPTRIVIRDLKIGVHAKPS